jgi:methyl-accepting chemotaxis protein
MKLYLKHKLILLIVLLLIVNSLIINYIIQSQVTNLMVSNELGSNLKLESHLLDKQYPGNWSIKNNKLYKGTKLMNGDTILVDMVKHFTGACSTIFLYDTRVSTNIMDNGKRAVGTRISDDISKTVLVEGNDYTGNVTVLGKNYYGKYTPLKNSSGTILGALFIGVSQDSIVTKVAKINMIVILLTIILIIFGVLIIVLASYSTFRNIKNLVSFTEEVKNGDLSIKYTTKSKDELSHLGNAFNDMLKKLSDLINKISFSSHQLAAASEEFTSNADETSKAAEQLACSMQSSAESSEKQLKSIEEVKNTLNQMSDEIKQISVDSDNITELAISSYNASKNGCSIINEVVGQMNDINFSVKNTKDVIINLGNSSDEIGVIVEIIKNITERTNLLSLNATIEAAKSGDAGRGFSVLANEIRNLSIQSKTSAQNITKLISNIQKYAKATASSIQKEADKIANGLIKAEEADKMFNIIQQDVSEVKDKIEAESISMHQILNHSNNIVKSIKYVQSIINSQVTMIHENAAASQEQLASMEEVSSASQTLANLAEELNDEISKFKV